MTSKSRPVPCLLLALLLAVSACGSTVDTDYPGEPLVTLQGQMTLAPGVTVNGPVRLALVWYPQMVFFLNLGKYLEGTDTRIAVAEDIPYEGSFPSNFRFNIYRPPPDEALVRDGTRRGFATGVLMAYEDRNGNGTLDTVSASDFLLDRVLAASAVLDEPPMLYLAYSEEEPDETDTSSLGLKKGFNLLRFSGYDFGPQPLSTPISFELSGGPLLDLLVCEPFWDVSDSVSRVEGNVCGIPGYDGVEPAPDALQVLITVKRTWARAQVSLEVFRGDLAVDNAEVTLGGRPVPYDPESGSYVFLETEPSPLTEGGELELGIRLGGKDLRRTVTIPGGFDITSPVDTARVALLSKLEVRWTRPTGADVYNIYLEASGGETRSALALPADRLAYVFYSIAHPGPATFRVEAYPGYLKSTPELQVGVRVQREVSFTFEAP